jgi:NADPH:quinone reductase-like Zn-dependent oxidoreductase
LSRPLKYLTLYALTWHFKRSFFNDDILVVGGAGYIGSHACLNLGTGRGTSVKELIEAI